MKVDEIWLVEYTDDIKFHERLSTVQNIITKYRILNADGYMELCIDHNIPCGRKDNISIDLTKEVKNYLKVTFR